MRVCLFDIDGTLISSGGAGKAALERSLEETWGNSHQMAKLSLSGRTDRAIAMDLMRLHDIEWSEDNWERLIAGYLRHLPACLESCRGRVLPGMGELLPELGRRGVLAGLLTGNIRRGAKVKLGHFGLYEHFQVGSFGDHHLDRDDVAREALAEVRARLGEVRPEDVWVIGDTPLDVQCARAIGANVVAVATGWHTLAELEPCGADLLVEDLGDFAVLLERLG